MKSLAWFVAAALLEIGGCFAFWAWVRIHKSPLWIIPGVVSLGLYALVLTRVDTFTAGRAYAAYGGVYMLSSLFWMWAVENALPDRWDLLGSAICLIGTAVILFGPRS